jgi:anti-sigma regulatory factor (Ser/Thr protein kinase)
MTYFLEVPAEYDSLARLAAWSDAVEVRLPLTFDQAYLMRLAIEEIATNMIKYGYAPGAAGPIQVRCECADGLLRVVVRDRGRPVAPDQSPARPNPTT